MTYKCHECGDNFSRIGSHWRRGSCKYPKISSKQHEIITGVLMGDGSINRYGKNPRLQVNMINKKYLEYVDSKFPLIGAGVSLKRKAKDNAELSRQTGFTSTVNEENYNDQHNWQTLCIPELKQYSNWYNSGEKVWPEDIQLTSTVLKHLYCNDGSLEKDGKFFRIKITMCNEINNKEKINKLFENMNLQRPEYWNSNKDARWNKESSKDLLNYMGEPLPGFEYKWPDVLL